MIYLVMTGTRTSAAVSRRTLAVSPHRLPIRRVPKTTRTTTSRRSHVSSTARLLQQGILCTGCLKATNAWLHPSWYIRSPSSSQQPTLLLAQSAATTTTTLSAFSLSSFWQAFSQRIGEFWRAVWDFMVMTGRTAEIFARLSPLLVLTPAAVAVYPLSNRASDAAWYYLTAQMQALGPVFVKLCQWAATRPDIFPPYVCQRLSCLHDRGLPHAWQYTDAMLRDAFGDDYTAKGLSVDSTTVIGCGSAAQVYRGTLIKNSHKESQGKSTQPRTVAIKVLHPNFRQAVDRDLTFLQTAAAWIHAVPVDMIRMLNLPRVAANFGTLLVAQADLRTEATHLQRFRRNFYGHVDDDEKQQRHGQHYSSITFPRPMDGWTSEQVLVEDLVDNAQPIATYLQDSSDEGIAIRKQLAGPLLRAFLKMIFIDNFTHGDLHPGNVFVRTQQVPVAEAWWTSFLPLASANNSTEHNDKEPMHKDDSNGITTSTRTTKFQTKRTIVFLDAGIATTLSPVDQRNLIDLFRAVILNKGEEAGRLMVERAKYERCSERPGGVQAFSQGIGALVAEFHDNRKAGLTLGAVRIGSLLSRVLDLCRIHGVEIDPSMASIVVSTLVLEGLGRSLEPSMDLMRFAMPFVLGGGRV